MVIYSNEFITFWWMSKFVRDHDCFAWTRPIIRSCFTWIRNMVTLISTISTTLQTYSNIVQEGITEVNKNNDVVLICSKDLRKYANEFTFHMYCTMVGTLKKETSCIMWLNCAHSLNIFSPPSHFSCSCSTPVTVVGTFH